MEIIDIEKLTNYKILPFDLLNTNGDLIFAAGEILTPGKLMQLKSFKAVYKRPLKQVKESYDQTEQKEETEFYDAKVKNDIEDTEENINDKQEPKIIKTSHNVETIEAEHTISPIDEIDEDSYIGSVNMDSLIDSKTQIRLKAYYSSIQKNIKKLKTKDIVKNYLEIRDKIIDDITVQIDKAQLFSELKLLGEYKKCHDLNVSILANSFGLKLGLNNEELQELTLAALLHDIGKNYMPKELLTKQNPTLKEKRQIELHTKIGYDIIKNQLWLSDRIAKPALQHHERIDGTGYPNKISEESIDIYSQIIGICNYFDNLTSNKTEVKIKNVHDALKYIITNCTKYYSSDILYKFVYMFSYNDIKHFEDMVM